MEPYDPIITNPFNPNPNPADLVVADSYKDDLVKDGWAGELSLNYRLTNNSSIWVGYDRVYRYPVLDEVAAYQGYPLSKPLNADLKPEVGDNFEIGVKYINQRWEASATFFYLTMDNEIAYDDTIKLNTNIGATRRLGSDLMLRYTAKSWGVSSQWSIVDARLEYGAIAGNRVPLVAELNAVSQAWVAPIEDLRVSLSMNYMGARYVGGDYDNSVSQLPSYVTFDSQVAYDFKQYSKLFVRVNNLLDHQYVSTAYPGSYYPAAGRILIIGLSVGF